PLRERVRSQLILALYRSGRQSEALAQYQATRRMLVEELGLEPGPELRQLERMILAHDPDLAAPERTGKPRSTLPLAPERLSGTVTFMFTDIEGSTTLLKSLGGASYGELLGDQQRLLRDVFAAHRGEEID